MGNRPVARAVKLIVAVVLGLTRCSRSYPCTCRVRARSLVQRSVTASPCWTRITRCSGGREPPWMARSNTRDSANTGATASGIVVAMEKASQAEPSKRLIVSKRAAQAAWSHEPLSLTPIQAAFSRAAEIVGHRANRHGRLFHVVPLHVHRLLAAIVLHVAHPTLQRLQIRDHVYKLLQRHGFAVTRHLGQAVVSRITHALHDHTIGVHDRFREIFGRVV